MHIKCPKRHLKASIQPLWHEISKTASGTVRCGLPKPQTPEHNWAIWSTGKPSGKTPKGFTVRQVSNYCLLLDLLRASQRPVQFRPFSDAGTCCKWHHTSTQIKITQQSKPNSASHPQPQPAQENKEHPQLVKRLLTPSAAHSHRDNGLTPSTNDNRTQSEPAHQATECW